MLTLQAGLNQTSMSLDKLKQQSDAHAAVASGHDASSEAIQAAKDAYTPAFSKPGARNIHAD